MLRDNNKPCQDLTQTINPGFFSLYDDDDSSAGSFLILVATPTSWAPRRHRWILYPAVTAPIVSSCRSGHIVAPPSTASLGISFRKTPFEYTTHTACPRCGPPSHPLNRTIPKIDYQPR